MRALGIALLVAVAVAALLAMTLARQGATCEVCVSFEGRRACRTASAPAAEEATQHAHATACAVLAGGVTADLACQRTVPERTRCE